MKKSYALLAPIMILVLGVICFAIIKYTAPASNHQQNFIAGLGDEFFTNFDLDQTIASNNNGNQSVPPNSSAPSGLLPVWDFHGPDILKAQKTTTDLQRGIFDRYSIRFQALKQIANERVNILANKGLQEYKENKAAGKLNKLELADKYYTAMSYLQENLDKTFNSELDKMESELKDNGFSTQVVGQLKTEYTSSKGKFQQEIMQRLNKQGS